MTSPAQRAAPIPLSETEDQILRQVVTGATNREIARDRGITEATVKKHLTNINAKLGTSNRTEAVHRALELGLVTVGRTEGEAAGEQGEMARRLAAELDRHRRRSRAIQRALAAVAVLAVAGAAAVAALGPEGRIPAPTPAPPVAGDVFWVPNKPLPGPRTGLALVTVAGETFAVAGDDGSGPVASMLRYPPAFTVDWEPRQPKPTAVRDVRAVALRGQVVVPGGCDASGRALAVVEGYDPATDRWTELPPLPEPLCGYGLAELGGEVYLFGGRSGPDAASASDAVLRYADDGGWVRIEGGLPDHRADLAAVADQAADAIHLLGGRDVDGRPERSHWVFRPYAPAADRWDLASRPELPEGRAGHAAVVALAPAARLVVVGGGWDRRPEPAAIELDLSGEPVWRAAGDIRGRTPWRGAALTLRERGELLLVGGEADGEPLAQSVSLSLLRRIFVP